MGTSKTGDGRGGKQKLPYVYTEQGIAMLSGLIRSDVAVDTSVAIMRAFVEMRRFLASNAQLFEQVREMDLRQLMDQERNEGYRTGAITYEFETKTFNYDRGIRLMADVMDVEEGGVLDCFVEAGSEL